jgi:hypothetical protein
MLVHINYNTIFSIIIERKKKALNQIKSPNIQLEEPMLPTSYPTVLANQSTWNI